jgi:hypothetical protein
MLKFDCKDRELQFSEFRSHLRSAGRFVTVTKRFTALQSLEQD